MKYLGKICNKLLQHSTKELRSKSLCVLELVPNMFPSRVLCTFVEILACQPDIAAIALSPGRPFILTFGGPSVRRQVGVESK
jgi:hypothetical protein